MRIYLDTSALAKAYITEPGSEVVRRRIAEADHVFVSALNVTEMRCLLARRARAGDFTGDIESRLWSAFQSDIDTEAFDWVDVDPNTYRVAAQVIDRVAPTPLRTLDALHLVIAEKLKPDRILTTDKQLSRAASAIGLTVDNLDH
jgi:uncharacterized protein